MQLNILLIGACTGLDLEYGSDDPAIASGRTPNLKPFEALTGSIWTKIKPPLHFRHSQGLQMG